MLKPKGKKTKISLKQILVTKVYTKYLIMQAST